LRYLEAKHATQNLLHVKIQYFRDFSLNFKFFDFFAAINNEYFFKNLKHPSFSLKTKDFKTCLIPKLSRKSESFCVQKRPANIIIYLPTATQKSSRKNLD